MHYTLTYTYQWYDANGNLDPSWIEHLPPTLQLLHESLVEYYEQLTYEDDSDSDDSADSTINEGNDAAPVLFNDDAFIEYENGHSEDSASDLSDEVEVEEAIISTMLHHA